MHGMEVGMVKVVGQVRNVDLRESSIAYQVVWIMLASSNCISPYTIFSYPAYKVTDED